MQNEIIKKQLFLSITERKNGVILNLKNESLAELEFDQGFRAIGEYLSQIDSILRVKLTRFWELNWLSMSGQNDYIFSSSDAAGIERSQYAYGSLWLPLRERTPLDQSTGVFWTWFFLLRVVDEEVFFIWYSAKELDEFLEKNYF